MGGEESSVVYVFVALGLHSYITQKHPGKALLFPFPTIYGDVVRLAVSMDISINIRRNKSVQAKSQITVGKSMCHLHSFTVNLH